MEWYRHETITPHIIGITDITDVRCFLVQGGDRALLIDTGTGAGNLRDYVEELMQLPYEVALTHCHVDHGGGAWAFDRAWLHPADDDLFKRHCSVEHRLDYIHAVTPNPPSDEILISAMGDCEPAFDALADGMTFDLGGVHVRAVAVPGHTQGMTCFLIEEDRAMLLGDAVNSRVFLFDEDCSSVEDYRKSLIELQKWDGEYDIALYSHGPAIQTRDTVAGCIALTEEILAGTDDHVPFEFMGTRAYMAKRIGPDGISRLDGGAGNIVYRA